MGGQLLELVDRRGGARVEQVGTRVAAAGDTDSAHAGGERGLDVERRVADQHGLLRRAITRAGARDADQLGAVARVGAEAALPGREEAAEPAEVELAACDRLEVAGDEREVV